MELKNTVLLGSFLLITATFHAQHNYDNQSLLYSNNGKLGIGTNAPNSILHVYEVPAEDDAAITLQNRSTYDPNATASLLFTHSSSNFDGGKIVSVRERNYEVNTASTAYSSLAFHTAKNGSNNEHLRITSEGRIGVGTDKPSSKLHVFETKARDDVSVTVQNRSTYDPDATASLRFTHSSSNFDGGKITSIREGLYKVRDINSASSSLGFHTTKRGVNSEHMRISSDGNVGIGTTNPGDFKLAVEGIIGAREIGVTLDSDWNWPDYVFKNNYELPPLKSIKSFIDKHGHLPEIPSEVDVEREGIKLAELNIKMLKKIEELTLYLLQQNETLENQQVEIRKLKEDIEILKKSKR